MTRTRTRSAFLLITCIALSVGPRAHCQDLIEYWGPDGISVWHGAGPLPTPPWWPTGRIINIYPLPGHEDDWLPSGNGIGAVFALNPVDPVQDDRDGDGWVDLSIENRAPDGQLVWTYNEVGLSWSELSQWKADPANDYFSFSEPASSLNQYSPPVPGLWSFSFYYEGDLIMVEHALVIVPEPLTATLLLCGFTFLALRPRGDGKQKPRR